MTTVKHSFGMEASQLWRESRDPTGTSILVKTAHKYLGFQILYVRATHIYLSPPLLTTGSAVLMLHFKTFPSFFPFSFLCYFTLPSVPACGWPTRGKWVTPTFSGHNSHGYRMVGKGAKEGSFHIQLNFWVLVALKWMLPLMAKSIWDGDSVARLQTVTTADYNSTTPLPQSTLPVRRCLSVSVACTSHFWSSAWWFCVFVTFSSVPPPWLWSCKSSRPASPFSCQLLPHSLGLSPLSYLHRLASSTASPFGNKTTIIWFFCLLVLCFWVQ